MAAWNKGRKEALLNPDVLGQAHRQGACFLAPWFLGERSSTCTSGDTRLTEDEVLSPSSASLSTQQKGLRKTFIDVNGQDCSKARKLSLSLWNGCHTKMRYAERRSMGTKDPE